MRRRLLSPLRLVAVTTAAGLALAGCSGDAGEPGAEATNGEATTSETSSLPSPTMAPTGDVEVPEGVALTAQGSDLEFGETAAVEFSPDQKRSSVLEMSVTGARKGSLDDFKGFILDDKYKKRANYYYVDVTVENIGEENVGGAPVPLWGVDGDNTLLPAVNFTTKFAPCASTPLPKKFKPGRSIDTCLVYLSPDKGALESLSFRPDQSFDPIEWTGEIEPAKKDKPKKKSGKKKSGGNKKNN